MRIEELLCDGERAILDDAWPAVARLEHYGRDGADATRRRLEALYRQVVGAVRARDLEGLLAHTRAIARERFEAGFYSSEVRRAFSMLEDAIARHAAARLAPAEVAWGLGLVGTAFAHAEDALVCAFASLSPRARPPVTDLTALFRSTAAAARDRFAEDLVFPV